jgi:UDP-GlcNAc:undecaprenyl-phosphate GlcNAc-1-phosphate transferase
LALAGWALALAGALGGFLLFNFRPASIFMGDGGALPVGLLLGIMTLRAGALAQNSRLTIYVFPILAMLVPLLDTTIVSVTRLATGRGVSRRGLDHSHHRLLSLGLSDERVVLLCWTAALCAGAVAVAAGVMPHPYLIATLPLILLAAATAGLFMMDLTFDARPPGVAYGYLPRLARLILQVTYKWRLVDVALDAVVIAAAWFGAFLIRLDFKLDNQLVAALLRDLPWVMLAAYPAFFAAGVYRSIWRYAGLSSVIGYAQGAALAALLLAALSLVHPITVSGSIFVLFAILAFNLLVASRMSFQVLRMGIRNLALGDERVLIVGAGPLGEAAARSLSRDHGRLQQLVGFVDDDGFTHGKLVDGHPVLGSLDLLDRIHQETDFNQILIAQESLDDQRLNLVWSFASERDLDVRRFSIEVNDLARPTRRATRQPIVLEEVRRARP